MDRFERIDVGGMRGVHLVDIRGNDAAGAVGGVTVVTPEILDLQATDGGGHPAILVAVIVDAAGLADFPADGHAFEGVVFKDEIAGVVAFRKEKIFVERSGTDSVAEDVVLNICEREVALRDGSEAFHPIGDSELVGCGVCRHRKPPGKNVRARRLRENYSARKKEVREVNETKEVEEQVHSEQGLGSSKR